ncbi:MAG: succinylglutamate desuccinylase/aspartoacylase family protein [Prolixibacteraceae bacterium]|nr:succinylglutamate desuccinylase/aspartoacylase family protein [Prolixibacteraceae bacterium]
MRILNQEILPGSSHYLNMDIARLHTHTKIEVPVIVERAKADGPCLLILGGIHGNEINGVEIVRKIVALKINKPKRGTTICIPVLNVFGFLNQQREFPDGRDLNRVFPGSTIGSLASRFAHEMMTEIIPHTDYCIDYHTGGDGRFNYPQLRIAPNDNETLEMAKAFGVKFIKFAKHREKSFREIANKHGIKILLYEGGKTLNLDQEVTNYGVQGAMNIMEYLGMRDFNHKFELHEKPAEQVIISSSTWIRAKHSGMFRSDVELGTFVKKGETLGSISDPFGYFEKPVKATNDGYVFCCEHSPIVNQGNALVHLSTSFITNNRET